jgi:hypothetical protein
MTLFLPKSAIHRLWPWTANVERILRSVQPRPFAGPHVALASDYGGDHKASKFRVYCYLIMDTKASPEWPQRRQSMRRMYLPDGRRMSFKSLGDGYRRPALVPFLQAADTIHGHIVCLIVTKSFENMSWRADYSNDLPSKLGLRGKWKASSFEAMFRTAHMFAVFLGLWSCPGMHVTWITDQDEIVANDDRLDDTHQIAARLSSAYIPHSMGVFAMNSTAIDDKDRAFEDLVAIPDLAAGMLSEIASKLAIDGMMPAEQVVHEPAAFTEKSEIISDWFWWPHSVLRRTCILIDRLDEHRLRTQKITMHYST